MRLSLPFVALCAIPAAVGIAIPDSSKEIGKSDYDKHHGEHYHGVHKYHHGDHKHKHKHLHPHEHIHHVHHKHPIKPCPILTKERVCKDFHELTDEVEKVIHVAQTKDCGNDESCWSVRSNDYLYQDFGSPNMYNIGSCLSHLQARAPS
jgi:hypothetical protein